MFRQDSPAPQAAPAPAPQAAPAPQYQQQQVTPPISQAQQLLKNYQPVQGNQGYYSNAPQYPQQNQGSYPGQQNGNGGQNQSN